jgi:hypothetical protein
MMSHCQECFTRLDACSECHAQEIAKRDAEIARLTKIIIHMTRTARIALQEALGHTYEIEMEESEK